MSVSFHPGYKLMMEHCIFFPRITIFIHEINTYIFVVRVYFTTTGVHRHKYWFDTRSCLSHNTGGSCRRNSQTGNITATIFSHHLIQFRIGIAQTLNERIFFFAFGIINCKCTTFFCHNYRRTISRQSKCFVNFFREIGSFISSVTET